jgi:hypothetical protein
MTVEAVHDLLGEPVLRRTDAPGQAVSYYGGFQRMKWCTMEITFGPAGRVIGRFHDH